MREYWILDFVQEKVLVYFFESDVYPVIYGFDKPVPVNIYNGNLRLILPILRDGLRKAWNKTWRKEMIWHIVIR